MKTYSELNQEEKTTLFHEVVDAVFESLIVKDPEVNVDEFKNTALTSMLSNNIMDNYQDKPAAIVECVLIGYLMESVLETLEEHGIEVEIMIGGRATKNSLTTPENSVE